MSSVSIWWAPLLCLVGGAMTALLAALSAKRRTATGAYGAFLGASLVVAGIAGRYSLANDGEPMIQILASWIDFPELHVDLALRTDTFGIWSTLAVAFFGLTLGIVLHRLGQQVEPDRHARLLAVWALGAGSAQLTVLAANQVTLTVASLGISASIVAVCAITRTDNFIADVASAVNAIGIVANGLLIGTLAWATAGYGLLHGSVSSSGQIAVVGLSVGIAAASALLILQGLSFVMITDFERPGSAIQAAAAAAVATLAGVSVLNRNWGVIDQGPAWLLFALWTCIGLSILAAIAMAVPKLAAVHATSSSDGPTRLARFGMEEGRRVQRILGSAHWTDQNIFCPAVNSADTVRQLIDVRAVDRFTVNGIAFVVRLSGDFLRFLQTGNVRNYSLIVVVGVIFLAALLW